MLFVLAAGLLLIAVALLILRPLLAPSDPDRPDSVSQPTDGAAPDPLEVAIAERRARMAEREGGR